MSAQAKVDLPALVALAVQVVGPVGERDYASWHAEVDRVALDLHLKMTAGSALAKDIAELSACEQFRGTLGEIRLDEATGRATLLLHTWNAEARTWREIRLVTASLQLREGRRVHQQAVPLSGHLVRVFTSKQDGGDQVGQVVRHIVDEGIGDTVGAARAAAAAAQEAPSQTPAEAPVRPRHEPPAPAPAPVPAPVPAPAPVPVQAAVPAPAPVAAPLEPSQPLAEQVGAQGAHAAFPPPPPPPPVPAAEETVAWKEASVIVWKNINRAWDKSYRTSCLLAIRDRAVVDDSGGVLNLQELIDMARLSPDPDSANGKAIAASYTI
ncbi:hypothetical protein [Wenjunlia tyrosinilytica]|uniref:Uncharacterized protein n=1 Tax=Wenjunlia tyrosinilytica TaxID=1544741 RepID=A0A917ZX88_9ACTN|nr:hypothetical protein [Wenjunlia tyrosinilytica]GGO98057.1 hypothetical protein GCM10012280_61300 [Wenjunlia tyrosinilytica]